MPIPKFVKQHIDAAFPSHVCLVGTCLPTGFAQISPWGSVQIYDDDHLSFWVWGGGSTADGLIDGSKVTIYFHNHDLMPATWEDLRVGKGYGGGFRTWWSAQQ